MRLIALITFTVMLAACKTTEFSGNSPTAPATSATPAPSTAKPSATPTPSATPLVIGPSVSTGTATTQVIKGHINVTREPDTAAWTNCLKVQINGGPEIDLGCNKGALAPTVEADLMAKPFCNQVRLLLYSNGNLNRSTQNLDNIAQDFRIEHLGPSNFHIQCNDNRDSDYNDLNLTISSSDASFTVENSGIPCG